MATSIGEFFEACLGQWSIERTYHYLESQEDHIERSHTNYDIQPLGSEGRLKVLIDNSFSVPTDLELYGFSLAFDTVSDRGDKVAMALNLLFVPETEVAGVIEGSYLRDRAYEEAKPMVAHFCYDPERAELLMTTRYTRVVSIDSIILVNPSLRIRKIQNFRRPLSEQMPLTELELIGFGVEKKVGVT